MLARLGDGDDTVACEKHLSDRGHWLYVACSIDAGPGNDTLTGAGSARGGPGRDTIYGTHGRDSLDGGPGSDTIHALAGDDYLSDSDNERHPDRDLLDGGEGSLDRVEYINPVTRRG